MGFFSRLFGKKNNTLAETENESICQDKDIQTIPISEVTSVIPSDSTVIASSSIPASCSIGNLVFEKKYAEAVQLGLKLLNDNPNDCGVHINLMDAYIKGKEVVAKDYIERSSHHAKLAILNGHDSGYAYERLAKNLDKSKKYHQSLQLYNLILETEGFHFSTHGCGNGIDWNHRKESVLKKFSKAVDCESDILFTTNEISKILQEIKSNDVREQSGREASAKRLAALELEMEKEVEEFLRVNGIE